MPSTPSKGNASVNRVLKGVRAFVAAGAIAALVQGVGSIALGPSADATNARLTATTAVNIRSGPSTSDSRIGVLYRGEHIQSAGATDGWTKVTWNGKQGYISSSYLTTSTVAPGTPATPPASASKGDVYTTANLNLRTGPGISNPVAVVATQGTKLTLTGSVSGSFSQVTYNGQTLWASTQYLSTEAGAPTQSLPAVTGEARATSNLMIRTTSTLNFKSLGDVPRGTILQVTGVVQNNMAQVIWQGNVRWVNNTYLTLLSGGSGPSAPNLPSTTTQYATADLNIWSASTGQTYSGVIARGSAVAVTGKVTNGRAEIVHNGALRWVTAQYLAANPPASGGSGSDRGDINKGYSSGLDKTNANVQRITWYVWDNWSQIKTMYGWRRDVTPDHPAGRAVDVMIPSYKTNKALGWEIANYFREHAAEYNINYIIFDQKIWNIARDKEGWRSMANRGSDSANHLDHVHINTYG